jgi:MFS family permease
MLFLTIYVSEHLQMGKPFASACVGVFGVGSALSAVFGGQLADTLGRRPAMLIALFGGATILASLSLITNGWLFMAALFGFALVMEMYRPASSAMIGDVVSPLQRPLAFGLLYLSFNLGFAIAPQIGGWLAAHVLMRSCFWQMRQPRGCTALWCCCLFGRRTTGCWARQGLAAKS